MSLCQKLYVSLSLRLFVINDERKEEKDIGTQKDYGEFYIGFENNIYLCRRFSSTRQIENYFYSARLHNQFVCP